MTSPASGLPDGLTPEALAAAAAESVPDSLAAAGRLRATYGPDVAAAAVTQVLLRRQAKIKFGDPAERMFFTRAGLEQATRPEVAAHHARRMAASGISRVLDLGCGIGADTLAFAAAGMEVLAVEVDPRTAAVAAANVAALGFGDRVEVVIADATEIVDGADLGTVGVFVDPARRSTSGRLWKVEDFTPPWSLVQRVLAESAAAGIKLGPALPHSLIPDGVEAEWTSHRGDTVEVVLWSGPGAAAGATAAHLLPAGHRLTVTDRTVRAPVAGLGRYVYEPDGAAMRAGAIAQLAEQHNLGLIEEHLAYLTGDGPSGGAPVDSAFLQAFDVLEQLPLQEKLLRRWVRDHQVGALEIKKRGLDLDPAALRRRMKPHGPERATWIMTRLPSGSTVLVVERVGTGL